MAMTNEQLTKWIDEIFGTIDEIKQNSGDISGLTRSVRQLREDLTATQADVTDLEDQTAGTVTLPKAQLQHFTDASATQALDLVADIIPVQAGTGDPTPTNVRAITGYSSVTATAAGKNLWKPYPTLTLGFSNSVGAGGAFTEGSYSAIVIPINNTHYSLSNIDFTHLVDNAIRIFVSEDYPAIGVAEYRLSNKLSSTTPIDLTDYSIYSYLTLLFSWTDPTSTTIQEACQIEAGETASDYDPYTANTATISLGSTVYSGDVNPTTGALTVNMSMLSCNGAEAENWLLEALAENNNGFYIAASGSVNITAQDTVARGMCDIFKFISASELNSHADDPEYAYTCALLSSHNIYFLVPKTVATTVAEFKTWLASHNINALYQLNEQQTSTVTPAQLSLLQGENNVSATSGPITLTYAPDNVLAEVYAYIQKRFDTLTASLAAGRTTRKTTKTLTKKED